MKTSLVNPLLIDTDAGHDDVLALMLLIQSNLFDIKAITTVAGNSTIENVTRNASYALNLLKRPDISIFSGSPDPLSRQLVKAVVHGTSGLDGADFSTTTYALTNDAPEKIIELVKRNPHELTILTLGPLSNIARAFEKDPTLPGLVKEIVIMGGAINVPGNKNRVAEFNMFVDPEAADIVFRADVSKVLVPLDACNNIILLMDDFEKLKGSELYEPIMNMMKHFIHGIEKFEGTKGALVYDALAGYYLVNPDAFTLEGMDVVVETKGEYTFGMTVAEKRKSESKNINVNVATSIDKDQFVKDFVSIIGK